MRVNDFAEADGVIYRILAIKDEQALAISATKNKMPKYMRKEALIPCDSFQLAILPNLEEISPNRRAIALQRYSVIAPVVAVVEDEKKRNEMIQLASTQYDVSPQTVRNYLKAFLIAQDIAALAPPETEKKRELTLDEKNMRWGLNKFFYTRNKNSLSDAYTMMLKEKYCDEKGQLLAEHPSFYQFRYFYRKTKKLESYYISREGLTSYQRDNRPLLGDGVQEYAPNIGMAMVDGTICDIYLVSETGEIVGRPILVAACDANTSLCLGYSLLWEGGVYSLQQLMLSIIEDKNERCKDAGIELSKEWNVYELPSVIVSDKGSEYAGSDFEQITELGIQLINLPPYRPELKGVIEKFFDCIQNLYKPLLKGKGVIMSDYQERGAHDYRRDACLAIEDFERIILRCIVFYNNERVIKKYPFSKDMIDKGIRPYAQDLWNYKLQHRESNLIPISKSLLILTLLPRTKGKFTRWGLVVNELRYYAEGYKEHYLKGGDALVTYNPSNASYVWLKEKDGSYIRFDLIESRFLDRSLDEVTELREAQASVIKNEEEENLKAKIALLDFIETVAAEKHSTASSIKGIRTTRKNERKKGHRDIYD